MNNKYRGLYFLGATILIGLLIIGVMRLMNQKSETQLIGKIDAGSGEVNTHEIIEQKIIQLTIQNVEPSLYNTLLIEIENGASQGLYNENMKNMLLNNLNQKYQSLVFQKLNGYLNVDPINYSEVNKFLSHLEDVFSASRETREIKARIKTIQYYSVDLPQKVNKFIDEGYGNFDDNIYQILIKELNSVPEYLRKRKFIGSSIGKLRTNLVNYKEEYKEWDNSVSLNP